MVNLYEAAETLKRIKLMVKAEDKANPKLTKTPDGKPPVYHVITVHGPTGMILNDEADTENYDPLPPLDLLG